MLSLNEYNKNIFDFLKKDYTHFQVGFFNSNEILFIGQNPGQPFSVEGINNIKKFSNIDEYQKYEKKYTEDWKRSLFGKFINQIIDSHWDKISFTNLVKISTKNNTQPSQEMLDIFLPIIKHQIKLLQPQRIVCFGRFVGNTFRLSNFYESKNIENIKYILVPHPAFLYRTNQINSGCDKIKQIIKI